VLSRLGVFTGCEGECREALIAGELEGVLQVSELAGWTERDVRLLCWLRDAPLGAVQHRAPLPAFVVGYVGPLWALSQTTARQHGFAHNSLPCFLVIMAPSGTRRSHARIFLLHYTLSIRVAYNIRSCRIAITAASALGSAQGWLVPIPDCSFLQWAEWPFPT
jgi:hypothetical protein